MLYNALRRWQMTLSFAGLPRFELRSNFAMTLFFRLPEKMTFGGQECPPYNLLTIGFGG
ncbi:MAG: hypothetical protein IJM09_01435 [Neisseriaceae bacterium]|nr:hypothetical protein [Neisseriaceae bacterium]